MLAGIIQRKKAKGMVSEGLIVLVTWNTTGSHSIFKFKYNSYKHFRRLGSLGWSLLRSDKTKPFLKYLANSSFANSSLRNKITLYPLQSQFLYRPQPTHFQQRLCFCSLHKTFHKDTDTFGQALPKVPTH